jgi:hypothetical protein
MDDAAGIADKLTRGQPAQFPERGCAQRCRILFSIPLSICQKVLWRKLERLKETTAFSDGTLKQALRKRRGHQDADRY